MGHAARGDRQDSSPPSLWNPREKSTPPDSAIQSRESDACLLLAESVLTCLTFRFLCCTILPAMTINVRRTRSTRRDPRLILQIGHLIQQLREERGWSQRQFAARLGISTTSLSYYESGDRVITLPTLLRVSQIFGVPIDILLPGGGTEPLDRELHARVRRVLALQDRGSAVLILDTLLSMCGFLQASRPEAVRSGEGR